MHEAQGLGSETTPSRSLLGASPRLLCPQPPLVQGRGPRTQLQRPGPRAAAPGHPHPNPSQNPLHSARSQPKSPLSKPAFSSWCQPNSSPLLVRDSQNLCWICAAWCPAAPAQPLPRQSPGSGGNPAARSPARACEGQRGEQRARPWAPRPSAAPPPALGQQVPDLPDAKHRKTAGPNRRAGR